MLSRPAGNRLPMAVCMLWLVPGLTLAQPDIRELVETCEGCHGENGVSTNPMVPTLAGQPYTLLEDNLLAFRAGGRSCAESRNDGSAAAVLAQTMCATVAGLSDAEIAALSSYFEGKAFVPADQTFDPALARRGRKVHEQNSCEGCHSDGGRTTNRMAPILAGQWKPYLRRAMQALRAGDRHGPKVMNAAIRDLDQDETEALLHYYASVGAPKQADALP